ncbi:MAG: hypothetical protein GY714_15785 [Desulfobacterales bacterium]|nr:hypothetical protein [Desulfobacterales bacterium]
MKDFKICINSELCPNIDGHYKTYRDNQDLFVIGNLYGAYYKNTYLNDQETISLFHDNIQQINKIIEIIQCTAGDYYLIIKQQSSVYIFSSTNTPGIFYKEGDREIFLTNIISDAFVQSSVDKLEQTQLFNYIYTVGIRASFDTFFSNVKRAPGGSYLKISNDWSIDNIIYVKKSYNDFSDTYTNKSDKEKYDSFKSAIDVSTQLIANHFGNEKIYLMVSGGADSCMMLSAFLNAGIKPIAINWQSGGSQGRWQDKIIEKLSKEMGFEYKVIRGNPISEVQTANELENHFKKELFEIVKNPYIQLYHYFNENNINDAVVFSGQNLDGLFEFFTSFKSAYIGLKSNILEFITRIFCEIMGTDFFFRNISKFKRFFQFLIKREINYPYYDYLLSMSNNTQGFETMLPYTYLKTLNKGSSDFIMPLNNTYFIKTEVVNAYKRNVGSININSIHLGIQEKTLLNRLLDNEDEARLKNQKPLEKRTYFNHLIRLLKYLNAHQPFILKYSMMARSLNYQLKNYGDQDILRKFCLEYNRNSFKDLYLPKRFKYKFINENLPNSSYKKITKAAALETGWRRSIFKAIFVISKNTIKSILRPVFHIFKKNSKRLTPKGNDLTMLKEIWNRNKTNFFEYTKIGDDTSITEYFKDIENKLNSLQYIENKNEYNEIERFVKLKVYLNEILSKQMTNGTKTY